MAIDGRITAIATHLREMGELSGKLSELLAPEIVSYEIVESDLEHKRNELKNVRLQIEVAKVEIESAKNTAKSIVDTANEKAVQTVGSAQTAMLDEIHRIQRLLVSAEEFVGKIDRKRYEQIKSDVDKVSA